jgi:hypothetical protein
VTLCLLADRPARTGVGGSGQSRPISGGPRFSAAGDDDEVPLLPVGVGLLVGDCVGLWVGDLVGLLVGDLVGDAVGLLVGDFVGLLVGLLLGEAFDEAFALALGAVEPLLLPV